MTDPAPVRTLEPMAWLGPLDRVEYYWSDGEDVTMLSEDWRRLSGDWQRVSGDWRRAFAQEQQRRNQRRNQDAWNREVRLMKQALAQTLSIPDHQVRAEVLPQSNLVTGSPVIEDFYAASECRCKACWTPEPVAESPMPWDSNPYLKDEDRAWLAQMWALTTDLPQKSWVTTELVR